MCVSQVPINSNCKFSGWGCKAWSRMFRFELLTGEEDVSIIEVVEDNSELKVYELLYTFTSFPRIINYRRSGHHLRRNLLRIFYAYRCDVKIIKCNAFFRLRWLFCLSFRDRIEPSRKRISGMMLCYITVLLLLRRISHLTRTIVCVYIYICI